MNFFKTLLVLAGFGVASLSYAQPSYQIYDSAAAFSSAVKGKETDDFAKYTNFTNYTNAQAQAASVANIGYVSTAFPNMALFNAGYLCWGCNGSGYMDLSASNLGTKGGVYGFMTDYVFNSGNNAYITFANGSTLDVGLAQGSGVLAITSSDLISKVEFSSGRGQKSYNVIAFKDVSVANAVPEPASLALLGLGLAGIAALRRRK